MNIALIKDKIVQNIAVFETLQEAIDMATILGMDEAVEATATCIIGHSYENGEFIIPEHQPSEMELKIQTLETQVKALSDQNEFLENCLVEMATVVYA